MKSFYSAYQAYEKRFIRGEMSAQVKKTAGQGPSPEPLLARLGDLLILAGLRLKRQRVAGKPMAWSPLTGSKP